MSKILLKTVLYLCFLLSIKSQSLIENYNKYREYEEYEEGLIFKVQGKTIERIINIIVFKVFRCLPQKASELKPIVLSGKKNVVIGELKYELTMKDFIIKQFDYKLNAIKVIIPYKEDGKLKVELGNIYSYIYYYFLDGIDVKIECKAHLKSTIKNLDLKFIRISATLKGEVITDISDNNNNIIAQIYNITLNPDIKDIAIDKGGIFEKIINSFDLGNWLLNKINNNLKNDINELINKLLVNVNKGISLPFYKRHLLKIETINLKYNESDIILTTRSILKRNDIDDDDDDNDNDDEDDENKENIFDCTPSKINRYDKEIEDYIFDGNDIYDKFEIQLNNHFVENILDVTNQEGYLIFKISNKTFKNIPENFPYKFDTKSFRYIIPCMYRKFPEYNILITTSIIDSTKIVFSKEDQTIEVKLKILINMSLLEDPTYTLVEISSIILVKVELLDKADKTKLWINAKDIMMTNSKIEYLCDSFTGGQFEVGFNSIKNTALYFINSMLLEKGFNLPEIKGIKFKDIILKNTDNKLFLSVVTISNNNLFK